jgi:epoxyqueuosine reductase
MSSVNSTKTSAHASASIDYSLLANHIKAWGKALGFQQLGVCDIDLSQHKSVLETYLKNEFHGEMHYLERNVDKRLAPEKLHPNTCRIISVRMDYLPPEAQFANNLKNDKHGYVSRYALGRDYHKVMRAKLKQLGEQIKQYCHDLDFRPFVDSAPVLEHAIAEKAGLGWTGKHTLTLNEEAGSWFFWVSYLSISPCP